MSKTAILLTGFSPRHLMRIRYKLVKELREAEVPGVEVVNPAGHGKQSWVLISIGDVAIH